MRTREISYLPRSFRSPIGSVHGGPGRIHASRMRGGESVWSVPVQVHAPVGSLARPQAVALGGGRSIAVWEQTSGGRTSINGSLSSGSTWQQWPTLLESDDRGDAGAVQLAAAGAGTMHAVWMQFDGSAWTVWSARFSRRRGSRRERRSWLRRRERNGVFRASQWSGTPTCSRSGFCARSTVERQRSKAATSWEVSPTGARRTRSERTLGRLAADPPWQ